MWKLGGGRKLEKYLYLVTYKTMGVRRARFRLVFIVRKTKTFIDLIKVYQSLLIVVSRPSLPHRSLTFGVSVTFCIHFCILSNSKSCTIKNAVFHSINCEEKLPSPKNQSSSHFSPTTNIKNRQTVASFSPDARSSQIKKHNFDQHFKINNWFSFP